MEKKPFINEADKIVLSDLLYFMQNKLQSMTADDLIAICNKFYQDDYVWQEKEKYFDAIGKKPIKPRSGDKKVRDLQDILHDMQFRDASGDFQPTCVSLELSNIPQSK